MIARVLSGSCELVDTAAPQARFERGADQEVINAKPGISGKGVAEILSEGVDPLIRMKMPDGIRPTLRDQICIGLPHLWPEQSVITPALRFVNVENRWASN